MGVELLAFGAAPVAVAPVRPANEREYQPALLLPAVESVAPAGDVAPAARCLYARHQPVAGGRGERVRTVRLLKRLEHSNIFESIVFADVLKELRAASATARAADAAGGDAASRHKYLVAGEDVATFKITLLPEKSVTIHRPQIQETHP